jgi:hypothetical protein
MLIFYVALLKKDIFYILNLIFHDAFYEGL